jgi:uncharacterized protein (DUF362 family)
LSASKPSTPIVVVATADTKLEALHEAVDTAELENRLQHEAAAAGKARADYLIAIKPNLMAARRREEPPTSYTDPELVERLVAWLRERGYSNVAIVESRTTASRREHRNRTVQNVAAMVGYSGVGYRIADLTEDTVPFDYGGVLGRHQVGRTWRDADFRISFAKNKTHRQMFYTGAMANIFGCLPEPEKFRHYTGKGHEYVDCCRTALDALPVAFGLVDAWYSADGGGFLRRRRRPAPTKAVLASGHLLALDWVMGEKMGIDPALNPLVQEAVIHWGRVRLDRRGNLTPWHPWRNPGLTGVALAGLLGEPRWPTRLPFRRGGTAWTIQ